MKYVRVNDRILAKTMRVIGPDGAQLGVFTKELAISKADELDLDLVEISPQADPPVCRIIDFSKYKYEQEKREKDARKHQKQVQLKEVRIRPGIDIHDFEIKVKHIKEFLAKRHKVRVRMWFKGREISHKDIGIKIIDKLIQEIEPEGRVDREPHMLGKTLVLILSPK
ncbi:MAG: translation initiation factor IF-3 [Candidatus Omnitrophica bacterium]|nr:translation initiation factor IF-3 [Candidatus Omnitrophota bacterium]MCK5287659.1 translation initiation factor IF-3 [Candidatus Omnitrophota bacterium]